MISKTKISKRTGNKTNKELSRMIIDAKKSNLEIAAILSAPTRKQVKKNLFQIQEESGDEETIIVPGKVLGTGRLDKKIKVIAMNFSASAREKLEEKNIKMESLKDVLSKHKKIEGKILR